MQEAAEQKEREKMFALGSGDLPTAVTASGVVGLGDGGYVPGTGAGGGGADKAGSPALPSPVGLEMELASNGSHHHSIDDGFYGSNASSYSNAPFNLGDVWGVNPVATASGTWSGTSPNSNPPLSNGLASTTTGGSTLSPSLTNYTNQTSPLGTSSIAAGGLGTNPFGGSLAGSTMMPPPPALDLAAMKAFQDNLQGNNGGPVAYINGDPTKDEELELFYYRFSGSTAIHPGINKISLKLHPRRGGRTPGSSVPIATGATPPALTVEEMFDENDMPKPHIYRPLIDIFFSTMSPCFPSVSRKRLEERLETGTMSSFMMICICALSARFSPLHGDQTPSSAAAPFIAKAQEMVVPLLLLPTNDVCTALMMLAWAFYGQGSESGLWQCAFGRLPSLLRLLFRWDVTDEEPLDAGICSRMAIDLGLHQVSEIYESAHHVVRTRLLWWSIVMTDVILSFSTGRTPSINLEIIELPLPTDEDMFPDPARNTDLASELEPITPRAFPYCARMFTICAKISKILNGQRSQRRTLVDPIDTTEELRALQIQLVEFYNGLPESLKWSVETFRVQESKGQGCIFLLLHTWANAVLTLVFHPDLTSHTSGTETPLSSNMTRSLQLSSASSRIINECLVIADLFSARAYEACPFIVQPIFVASLAFIHDMKSSLVLGTAPSRLPSTPSNANNLMPTEAFLSSLTRQNLSILTKALARIEFYWAGCSFVANILEQRASGLGYNRIDPAKPTNKKTFISLPDSGLVQRFSGKNLPHDTAPATDVSLRLSIARKGAEQQAYSSSDLSNLSIMDILSSYNVEGLYVAPADSWELTSLFNNQ